MRTRWTAIAAITAFLLSACGETTAGGDPTEVSPTEGISTPANVTPSPTTAAPTTTEPTSPPTPTSSTWLTVDGALLEGASPSCSTVIGQTSAIVDGRLRIEESREQLLYTLMVSIKDDTLNYVELLLPLERTDDSAEWGKSYFDVPAELTVEDDVWTVKATVRGDTTGRTYDVEAVIDCLDPSDNYPSAPYTSVADGTYDAPEWKRLQENSLDDLFSGPLPYLSLDGHAPHSITPACPGNQVGMTFMIDEIPMSLSWTLEGNRLVEIGLFTDILYEEVVPATIWTPRHNYTPPTIGFDGTTHALKGLMRNSDGNVIQIEAAFRCP